VRLQVRMRRGDILCANLIELYVTSGVLEAARKCMAVYGSGSFSALCALAEYRLCELPVKLNVCPLRP
jgi:hypothetical protein